MTKDNSTGKGLGFFAAGKKRFDSIAPLAKPEPQSPKPPEPAAWGMLGRDGQIVDCITPAEHARLAGEYTIALYRRP
jgi:hypothetical protein